MSVSEVDHLGLYTGVISDTSQLQKLQREVLLAAGEVQWRIGQALHDGPQQTLARQISEEYDLSCDLQCPESVVIEDHYTVDQLFHIAQEAVLNAANHSGADRIGIFLEWQGHTISLRVVDNGSGIKKARAGRQGLGMHIMPYRAATIGASLCFSDAAGGGTVVACTFNYSGAVSRE